MENKSKRHFTDVDGNAFRSHFTKSRNLPRINFDPDYERCPPSHLKWSTIFLNSLFYENPVWDLGIQRVCVLTDKKSYSKAQFSKYLELLPDIIVCPCSQFFSGFNSKLELSHSTVCSSYNNGMYTDVDEFVNHLISLSKVCRYHSILYDTFQFSYPSILAKVLKNNKESLNKNTSMKYVITKNRNTFREDENILMSRPSGIGRCIIFLDDSSYREVYADLNNKAHCKRYEFMIFDLLHKEDARYYKHFTNSKRRNKFIGLLKGNGLSMKSDKRSCTMYCFGSTQATTCWPRFQVSEGQYDMLPRPYPNSKPGEPIHQKLFSKPWFVNLVRTIDDLTCYYLRHDATSRSNRDSAHGLYTYYRSKKIIPSSLRICNSVFTNFTITTNPDGKKLQSHLDEDDIMTAVLTLGDDIIGGSTEYYHQHTYQNKPRDAFRATPVEFKNGQLQIGYFDKVYHSVRSWSGGERYALNFIMKKSVYDHFDDYGDIFYNQLVDRDFDCNGLIARLPKGFSFEMKK